MKYIKRCWSLKGFFKDKRYLFETYYTEDEAIWRMCSILDKMNIVDLATEGHFEKTVFNKQAFLKRYVLECYAPNIKFVIHKKSKGEINKPSFRYKLKKFKREFNEKDNL